MRGLYLVAVGVVISTAFVHVMLPAVHIFEEECFPEAFKSYEGWPAVLMLVGLLLTHLIQICTTSINPSEIQVHDGGFGLVGVELGIAVHSLIIGIALGIANDEFIPLLVALCIHQFFEGIAVASVLAQFKFKGKWTSITVAVIFVLSTPVGAMIGLLVKLFSTTN